MFRRLFTLASALLLLLCIGVAVLWVRGAGRAEGWYFKPSPTVLLQPPEETLPSNWCVQWQINWGGVAALSIERQFKPVPHQPRVGFFTFVMPTRRWNPLPQSERVPNPRIASTAMMSDGWVVSVAYRTKPATAWSHLGIGYTSHEQEFGKYPNLNYYFATGGEWFLRVPLLYLFVLFAILPCLLGLRLYRASGIRKGHCSNCRYNLTGNTSGVCPECGTPVGQRGAATA